MSERQGTLGGMLIVGALAFAVGIGLLVASLRDPLAALGAALLAFGVLLVAVAMLGSWWDAKHPRGEP